MTSAGSPCHTDHWRAQLHCSRAHGGAEPTRSYAHRPCTERRGRAAANAGEIVPAPNFRLGHGASQRAPVAQVCPSRARARRMCASSLPAREATELQRLRSGKLGRTVCSSSRRRLSRSKKRFPTCFSRMAIPAGSMPKHAQRTRKPDRADAAPVLCSRRCLGIRSAMVPWAPTRYLGTVIEWRPVAGLPGRAADFSLAPRLGFGPDDVRSFGRREPQPSNRSVATTSDPSSARMLRLGGTPVRLPSHLIALPVSSSTWFGGRSVACSQNSGRTLPRACPGS